MQAAEALPAAAVSEQAVGETVSEQAVGEKAVGEKAVGEKTVRQEVSTGSSADVPLKAEPRSTLARRAHQHRGQRRAYAARAANS